MKNPLLGKLGESLGVIHPESIKNKNIRTKIHFLEFFSSNYLSKRDINIIWNKNQSVLNRIIPFHAT